MTKREKFEVALREVANSVQVEARPFQERIRTKLNDGWDAGMISQLIVSPTGSGKTVMGLIAAKDYVLNIGPERLNCKPEEIGICWVAMRRNLLAQTEKANWQLQFESEKLEETNLHDENQKVLCPNIEYVSMFDKDAKERMAKYKYVFLVIDEAQHDAATTMVTLHTEVKPDVVLGLSATPQRSDSLKICFQREIRDAGYHFLIQDGYLSQFNHWVMREWTPRSVAKLYLKTNQWGKSLAFFLTRAECEEFSSYVRDPSLIGLKCKPRKVEVVHGGSNKVEQLDKFERGEVDILASMAVLTEGFDCPSLESVFVRDTRSKGPCIQMSGRVLRLWKGVAKNIVQSSGTKYPFTRFAHAKTQFVEEETGKWTSIGSNDRVDVVVNTVMKRMVKAAPPKLPDFLSGKKKAGPGA